MSVDQEPEVGSADSDALPVRGFVLGLSAYLLWGLLPLFLIMLEHIPAPEVLAHRIVWSVPVAGVILFFLGRTGDVMRAFKTPKIIVMMFITAALISLNWGTYIWAIAANMTSQGALGYYINPLMFVVLGAVLLGERLERMQVYAVVLAAFGVLVLAISIGAVPWVAFILATTFAIYGYLRKVVDIGPTQGFLIEVLLLAPFAGAYLIWLSFSGISHFEGVDIWLLIGTGPATAIPLILYAFGAKALRMSTIGLMQYIAPTMIFLIAVFVFREPMSVWQWVAFSLIWIALALYSFSMLRSYPKR